MAIASRVNYENMQHRLKQPASNPSSSEMTSTIEHVEPPIPVSKMTRAQYEAYMEGRR